MGDDAAEQARIAAMRAAAASALDMFQDSKVRACAAECNANTSCRRQEPRQPRRSLKVMHLIDSCFDIFKLLAAHTRCSCCENEQDATAPGCAGGDSGQAGRRHETCTPGDD